LKHSSEDSILIALAGVIGEAIDLEAESLRIGVGVSIVLGEVIKVDKESDSELDGIEPC
jgi:hypothetical protein